MENNKFGNLLPSRADFLIYVYAFLIILNYKEVCYIIDCYCISFFVFIDTLCIHSGFSLRFHVAGVFCEVDGCGSGVPTRWALAHRF